jgi:predicted transcriptional regulator
MRLVNPTDFEILDALADGKRNNAANLAVELDKNRDYINTRLPELSDHNLVNKIGPSEQSGLYAITDRGRAALVLRDDYEDTDNFEALIEAHRANHSET